MSNEQWNKDQAAGERALRDERKQRDNDEGLIHELRVSGVTTSDVAKVVVAYSDGSPDTRRIVAAMWAIDNWIRGRR
jgi:hypothetical protein